MSKRAAVLVVAAAIAVAAGLGAVWLLRTRPPPTGDLLAGLPAGTWSDGAVVGDLTVVFAGGGSVVTAPAAEDRLVLQPAPAGDPATTRAALVVSTGSYSDPCLAVAGRLQTQQQLRSGSHPNMWEVAWLVWDYTDNDHFSYALVKTGGWELGKRDPAYPGGQRFLATGEQASAPIGAWHDLRAERSDLPDGSTRTLLRVDGQQVADVVDQERPYRAGAVGVYTEDARVAAATLRVDPC